MTTVAWHSGHSITLSWHTIKTAISAGPERKEVQGTRRRRTFHPNQTPDGGAGVRRVATGPRDSSHSTTICWYNTKRSVLIRPGREQVQGIPPQPTPHGGEGCRWIPLLAGFCMPKIQLVFRD